MSDLETQIPLLLPVVKTSNSAQVEVKMVKCDSCGFTEDCTPEYITQIREKYNGRWICGLCVEAVKDEVLRSDGNISTEEALERHSTFCFNFQSSSPPSSSVEHPIFAMGRIMRRSLDSPKGLQSTPTSPVQRMCPHGC
ncbi:hypothetical protein POM88_040724 [Heracleum sosnowskyi]|uniref:Uncharacterized protein n=1 Tax=Heracleum sosnowskyi TaxID=360622 RepID=A0AAD8MAM3_9APIA|nr:hypothetical protein POM88_040724 [Heracleum sosnowskyi]